MNIAEDLRGEINAPAAKKLEDLIHLAELCVDLLQQNEEHYAEVRKFVLYFYTHSLYLFINVVFLIYIVNLVLSHSSMLST